MSIENKNGNMAPMSRPDSTTGLATLMEVMLAVVMYALNSANAVRAAEPMAKPRRSAGAFGDKLEKEY